MRLALSAGHRAVAPLALVVLDVGRPVGHRGRGLEEVDDFPALSLGGELVSRLGRKDGRGVGPAHAGLLDRRRVGLGQRPEPSRGDRVRVGAARVDLVGGENGGVRDDVAADLSQPALLTDGDRRLVEGHAAADRHEVALAGRGRLLRRVEQRGVTVVDHDVAPVDASRRVAPVGEGLGLLGELRLESGVNGVGGVVEHGNVDGLGRPPRGPRTNRRVPARRSCRPRARCRTKSSTTASGWPTSPPPRSSTRAPRRSRRPSGSPVPAAAPTFEARLVPCRTSSHPPGSILIVRHSISFPDRSGRRPAEARQRRGRAERRCTQLDPRPVAPQFQLSSLCPHHFHHLAWRGDVRRICDHKPMLWARVSNIGTWTLALALLEVNGLFMPYSDLRERVLMELFEAEPDIAPSFVEVRPGWGDTLYVRIPIASARSRNSETCGAKRVRMTGAIR